MKENSTLRTQDTKNKFNVKLHVRLIYVETSTLDDNKICLTCFTFTAENRELHKSLSAATLKTKCRFLTRPRSATHCKIELSNLLSSCHFKQMIDNSSSLLSRNELLKDADNVQLKCPKKLKYAGKCSAISGRRWPDTT
jgi:hypothetical protein